MTKEVMHPKAAAMEQLSFSASAGQTALAHLCGPLDENLRQMETILGVKIVRRGEQFRVSGEKHAAHRALRALEVLLDRVARTGAELTPNDIQWHFVGGDDEHRAKTANADEVSAGEVLLKTRRHDLRGRTPNQRAYLQAILSHDISFGIGPAGTGNGRTNCFDTSGSRSRRTSGIPAGGSFAEGGSVFAAALRCAF